MFSCLLLLMALGGNFCFKNIKLCFIYFETDICQNLGASLMTQTVRFCLQYRRPVFDPQVRKSPWRRECNPLQYSCLENSVDRRAWQATVHGVAKSQTWLSGFHFHLGSQNTCHSDDLLQSLILCHFINSHYYFVIVDIISYLLTGNAFVKLFSCFPMPLT